MAQLLSDSDSVDRCLNASRRHQRRCRAVAGAADFATRIQPAHAALVTHRQAADTADEAVEDARDDLEFADGSLDNEIRTVSARAEEFDRSNPGANTHAHIFGDQRPSDIIEMNVFAEPNVADGIATAIRSLGGSHALAPFAATLTSRAQASREAGTTVDARLRASAQAYAELEIAKRALCRAYEANYLDARRTLGKGVAERLFVRLRKPARNGAEEPTPPTPPAPPAPLPPDKV